MTKLSVDEKKLAQFENELDPYSLEDSRFPVRVLGYGEISTVLEIDFGESEDFAYKRMPLFRSVDETSDYKKLYLEYIDVLEQRIGVQLVPSEIIELKPENKQNVSVYIIQKKMPTESIGHKAIHKLPIEDIFRLVNVVLSQLAKVFEFNRQNGTAIALGIDGQISNWAIKNFYAGADRLGDDIEVVYLDTSTPLMQKEKVEQLNAELFLRSAPSFLVWVLRLFFLDDVLKRYYDFRKVCIDLIANFYKEQRAELVPRLIETVNEFFSEQIKKGIFEPITLKEVKSYYQEDAWIWRLYLAFRKFDRTLHRVFRKNYPYILPGKIKR